MLLRRGDNWPRHRAKWRAQRKADTRKGRQKRVAQAQTFVRVSRRKCADYESVDPNGQQILHPRRAHDGAFES
jgi:hypothetical protein